MLLSICLCAMQVKAQCSESRQILWGTSNGIGSFRVHQAAYTVNKDLIVCGTINGTSGVVVHFNQSASVKWAKSYSWGASFICRFIVPMSNGDFAVAGYTGEATNQLYPMIMRLNAQGTVIWTKRLQDISAVPGLTNQSISIERIAVTPDGGIVACGRKTYLRPDGAYNYRIIIIKLNSNGDISWTREDTSGNDDESYSLLVDGGSVVIVGTTNVPAAGTRYGFVEKLNPLDGSVQFLRFYKLGASVSNFFRSIEKSATGYEIGAQSSNGKLIYNIFKMNSDGTPLETKHLPPFGANILNQYYYSVPLSDGSSVIWNADWPASPGVQLQKISVARTAEWKYQYTQVGGYEAQIASVLPEINQHVMAVGHLNGKIYLLKPDLNGTSGGCTTTSMPFTVKDSLTYTFTSGTWQKTTLTFQPPYNITPTAQEIVLAQTEVCQSANTPCTFIRLAGDTTICTTDTTLTYTLQTTGNCSAPVQWSLSAPIGTLQTINGNSVSIRFTQAGTAVLKAEVSNSCGIPSVQQLTLDYRPTARTLNLGPNTTLCTGDTLNLSVNHPYSFIQWNNGSTARSIPVTTAGNYSVRVSSDGVCYLKDTMQVTMYPKPVLRLSKDSVLCMPDPTVLNAGPGFAQYVWQDGSVQQTYLPQAPGAYWVRIKDANGCSASDTAVITRQGKRPDDFLLFSDTSICVGEAVTLRLKTSFAAYNWNQGQSVVSSYTINHPGLYIAQVRTSDGCSGTDSILVRDKGCLQILHVPNAFTPNNDGKNDVFKASAIGVLDSYEMQVFNRWGELVFRSTEIQKGWNGIYKQKLQPGGVFVWIIKYRFAGQKETEMKKGAVVLIL